MIKENFDLQRLHIVISSCQDSRPPFELKLTWNIDFQSWHKPKKFRWPKSNYANGDLLLQSGKVNINYIPGKRDKFMN